jgi:uncharacterized protein with GYD domain
LDLYGIIISRAEDFKLQYLHHPGGWISIGVGAIKRIGRGGAKVATYILLSNLTDEGNRTLKKNPDRIKEVNKELEKMGGKVTAQYATLGCYDFVNIVEAPDNATIARISAELGSRGSVKIMTLPTVPIDTFIQSLK